MRHLIDRISSITDELEFYRRVEAITDEDLALWEAEILLRGDDRQAGELLSYVNEDQGTRIPALSLSWCKKFKSRRF